MDFDNDGFPGVYIANRLESKPSVRDYEPEFWLHDIYVDDAVDDLEASPYFMAKHWRTSACFKYCTYAPLAYQLRPLLPLSAGLSSAKPKSAFIELLRNRALQPFCFCAGLRYLSAGHL